MGTSIFPSNVTGVTVETATSGALSGDGSSGNELAVGVDGTTVHVDGSNQLAVITTGGVYPAGWTWDASALTAPATATVRILQSPPDGVTATPGSAGSIANGTYYLVMTALDGAGNETTASNEVSAHVTASGSGSISVGMADQFAIPATNYRIYVGTVAGAENLYFEIPVGGPLFPQVLTDLGTGTSGTPPATNTYVGLTVAGDAIYHGIAYDNSPLRLLRATADLDFSEWAWEVGEQNVSVNLRGDPQLEAVFTSTAGVSLGGWTTNPSSLGYPWYGLFLKNTAGAAITFLDTSAGLHGSLNYVSNGALAIKTSANARGSMDATVIGPVVFPLSDPMVVGAWWNNAGVLTISAAV